MRGIARHGWSLNKTTKQSFKFLPMFFGVREKTISVQWCWHSRPSGEMSCEYQGQSYTKNYWPQGRTGMLASYRDLRIPPASCRVVIQVQPKRKGTEGLGYHRLYAAWSFNFGPLL